MTHPAPPQPDESPSTRLTQIQALLDQALAAAEANRWKTVATLDQQCRDAMTELVQALRDTDITPFLKPLQQLRASHQHLVRLAEARRTYIVEKRRKSIYGRQSVRIYQQSE